MTHQSHNYQLNVTFLCLLVPFLLVEDKLCDPMNL